LRKINICLSCAKIDIIAGPSGASKTTPSFTLLPQILDCREFVNADEIGFLNFFIKLSIFILLGAFFVPRDV